jgi:hypothetical protein
MSMIASISVNYVAWLRAAMNNGAFNDHAVTSHCRTNQGKVCMACPKEE